jgi:CheY-like chemotaxis protein
MPTVLVVDDNPQLGRALDFILRWHGFTIWLAADGEEALEVYRRHRDAIGVVLLDVRMPGMDGPATLRALRAAHPDAVFTAYFMTADSGSYTTEELLGQGAVAVLFKPVNVTELVQLLRQQAVPA